MKSTLFYTLVYLLFYTVSGCNYKVFAYLKSNPIVFIGLYSLITVVMMYLPIYSSVEQWVIPSERDNKKQKAIGLFDIKLALGKYGWAIFLSIISSIGWQVISYGFLINQGLQGALLALLVTSLARVIEPILSVYLFGDKIKSHFFYWFGLLLSIAGIIIFQLSTKEYDVINTISPVYYIVSLLNIFLLVSSSTIKRFITSDPTIDTIPVRKHFLGINYQNNYFISVRLRAFIVDSISAFILCVVGLLFINKVEPGILQISALLWIGIIGGISYNIAMRIKNFISNTVTTVLDSFRPIGLYFIFPAIPVLFSFGKTDYILNSDLNLLAGLLLCFLGGVISIQFGKPEKSGNHK